MRIEIRPGLARGSAAAPPSKSYAHRLLIGAALADGESRLTRIGENQDILATEDGLRALGAEIRREGEVTVVRGTGQTIRGGGTLPCRESGSTLRFLIPVSLLGGGGDFTGAARLMERGAGVYTTALPAHGATVTAGNGIIRARGTLRPGDYRLPGNISSQYISGLLFALPLLPGESRLTVVPPFESRPYADMTLGILADCGIAVREEGDGVYHIPGHQHYRSLRADVEGDWSGAAFLFALRALGGDVRVTGLRQDSRQGDRICLTYLRRLEQPGAVLDVSECPDLAPVLFAVAAARHGAVFTGTRRLALKESDRAAVMAGELSLFGAHVICAPDRVTVLPAPLHAPTRPLSGHNDHRVVMALSVLATRTGAVLDGAEAVSKSFPDFFSVLASLGISLALSPSPEPV